MTSTISLTQDEALVLFEFLCHFDQEHESTIRDPAEKTALQNLLAVLEKTLVVPLQPDYLELLEKARANLRAL